MTAYDGESALELARAVHPDLLISDVVMPEMTGVELAIAVTETVPGCKVLLFFRAGRDRRSARKARHRRHDFTILTKPVHPTDMLKAHLRMPGAHHRSPILTRVHHKTYSPRRYQRTQVRITFSG
jgi:DNA-binding NtrC family response regulator